MAMTVTVLGGIRWLLATLLDIFGTVSFSV